MIKLFLNHDSEDLFLAHQEVESRKYKTNFTKTLSQGSSARIEYHLIVGATAIKVCESLLRFPMSVRSEYSPWSHHCPKSCGYITLHLLSGI